MTESYGLSKYEYRRLIDNQNVTAKEISKKVVKPNYVYRYRRLGRVDKDGWIENEFWKEDVDGICMFSVPKNFNKNDDDDCKVRFDNDEVLKYMYPDYKSIGKETKDKILDELERYKESLQTTMRVGCFSSANPLSSDMWGDSNFGDDGHGICFEYKVDKDNFYPDELSFLPVLYDDNQYDNTPVIKSIIDLINDKNNQRAANKMVCLGYGHTIIKPLRYEKEQEWRLVIPKRSDGAHLNFFNRDHEKKRDMSSAISAVYLGPKFNELNDFEKYRYAIIDRWGNSGVPIYQIIFEDKESLKAVEIELE